MDKSSVLNVDENIGGVLSYIFPLPVIFLFMKEKNEFIRFHSIQAIIVMVFLIIFFSVFQSLSLMVHAFGLFGWILQNIIYTVLGLASLALWVFLLIKAYQGERWKVPVVGDIAEKQLGK